MKAEKHIPSCNITPAQNVGTGATRRFLDHPRRSGAVRVAESVLVTAAALFLVEIVVRLGFVSSDVFPGISSIARTLAGQIVTLAFWDVLLETAIPWAVGLGMAIAIAVPLGVVLGLSLPAYRTTYLLFEILRTTPTIAALPLLVLIFGVGYQFTIVLVAWTSMWPLLIQTMYGVRDVDPVTIDTAKVYGLNWRRRITQIVLPSAVPFIATGMRLASVMAFVVAVAASLLVGGGGLGFAIFSAANAGDVPLMWARITVAGLVGLALTAALGATENRMLRWRRSEVVR